MMRSSGEKRLNHPKKVLCCHVKFLDDAVATYEIPKDAKGSVLFKSVVKSLELNNEHYFGLLYPDKDNFNMWLDVEKKIKSQMKTESSSYQFEFRVKYYVSEPAIMLDEELTRYQFVLQLKQDLFSQRLSCTFRTLALLASFIVQSELGDYDPTIHSPGYLKEFKFVPNQPPDLEQEITELHKIHSGQSPEEVELRYLEKAKWLTAYGVDMRRVKDIHGLDLNLGIAPAGIQIFQGDTILNTFEWPRITKLRFHQKKFYIKVQPKEPGSKEQEHCFLVQKTKHCKILWRTCLEHHSFYKNLPPVDRTATLLRNTTQKSHNRARANSRPVEHTSRPGSFNTPRSQRHEASHNAPYDTPRDRRRHEKPPTPRTPSQHPHTPSQHPHTPSQHPHTPSQHPHTPSQHPHTPSQHLHTAHSQQRTQQSTPSSITTNNTKYESNTKYDTLNRSNNTDYYSLPRKDNKRYDNSWNDVRDSNKYQDSNKQFYKYPNNHTTHGNHGNHGSHGNNISKRSKSIGAADVLDLDYPRHHRSSYNYPVNGYDQSSDFKTFFNDTVLQNKFQYNKYHGKSWGNVAQAPGSKSSPDVRLAASQPAFLQNSALRQANFLMTTEL